MPRKKHPHARLWLKPAYSQRGKTIPAIWYVIDRGVRTSTGCLEHELEAATLKFERYQVRARAGGQEKGRPASEVAVADVLLFYHESKLEEIGRPVEFKARIGRLGKFWEMKALDTVNGVTCRDYAAKRGSPSAARRELQDLSAAIKLYRAEGFCREEIIVTLPPRSTPREVWLTREEVAKLIFTAWRHREVQKGVKTDRFPWRHIAKFILLGVRTGTRAAAMCATSFIREDGFGWIDVKRGLYYRRPEDQAETKKRRPSVRLPSRLLAHLRRWAEKQGHPIEYNGEPVKDVDKAFRHVAHAAGIPHATPHVLRHTAVTWAMQAGADPWHVAGFFGMTLEMIENHYGHHHPDHLSEAVNAMDDRPNAGREQDGDMREHKAIGGNKRLRKNG